MVEHVNQARAGENNGRNLPDAVWQRENKPSGISYGISGKKHGSQSDVLTIKDINITLFTRPFESDLPVGRYKLNCPLQT